MKFTSVIVCALAAIVSAAPALKDEAQKVTELEQQKQSLNNLQFKNLDVAYALAVNNLDVNGLNSLVAQLAQINNLNLAALQPVFNNKVFDINALLQIQQLQLLGQLQALGALNNVNLAALRLQVLNLGVIQNLGAINLVQFVNPSVVPQVRDVVNNAGMYPSSPPQHVHRDIRLTAHGQDSLFKFNLIWISKQWSLRVPGCVTLGLCTLFTWPTHTL